MTNVTETTNHSCCGACLQFRANDSFVCRKCEGCTVCYAEFCKLETAEMILTAQEETAELFYLIHDADKESVAIHWQKESASVSAWVRNKLGY